MLLPRKWIETSTFIMLFGCLDQFLVHRDADNKGSTCHSKVVYIFAISPPKRDIGLLYLCKDVLEITFLALSTSLDLLLQVFLWANWSPQASFCGQTKFHWSSQGSRSWLTANLNNCSGPELRMIFLVVIKFKWQILLIYSFKYTMLLSV